jgi:hypothetical protein
MRTFLIALALLGPASLLSAQPVAEPTPGPAPEPAAVVFVTGLSTGASETGPLVGAVVSKGLTPRLTIEGQAAWLDRGPGMNGATAMGSLLVNLVDPDQSIVPFLALGGGIYHMALDMDRPGMFGRYGWMDGPGMMGSMWYGPGAMVGTGPLPWPDHVPQFYARRLGGVTPPLDGRWHMRSFTDPMVVLGGGVRIDLGPRFFVRPDARALMIFGGGDTTTVGTFNIGLGVRF